VFSEKAAWEFLETQKATFSLTTLCPTLMFGPVTKPWQTLDDLNTSNQRIQSFIAGDYKTEIPDTGKSFFLWIDVRDVAVAHIRVMEVSSTASRRYLLTSGYFSNKEIGEIIRENFPANREQLPGPQIRTGGYPANGVYGFDNSRATADLGLSYRTLTESVVDTVVSLQDFHRRDDTGTGNA
jgi:nucleoside-diphosphate-sugar epimerase